MPSTQSGALIATTALLLTLAMAGCRDEEAEVGPRIPAPPARTVHPRLPPQPDRNDPPTDPCAFPGDPLCPDTDITVPGPHLPDW